MDRGFEKNNDRPVSKEVQEVENPLKKRFFLEFWVEKI